VVECLPGKRKALSLNPVLAKTKNRKKRKFFFFNETLGFDACHKA
jgi:hypothetical protein